LNNKYTKEATIKPDELGIRESSSNLSWVKHVDGALKHPSLGVFSLGRTHLIGK